MKYWWVGGLCLWGAYGFSATVPITVHDGSHTYAGTIQVGAHYPNRLGRLAHYVPGITTWLVAGTSRLVAQELEAREDGRPVQITYGHGFEVETEISSTNLERITGARDRLWLVPDLEVGDPRWEWGYDGPLQVARVDEVRFHRRRDPQKAPGVLQARLVFDHGTSFWVPLSALVRAVNSEVFLGSVPVLFAQAGDDWRDSEPLEWMEMRPGSILALSRRQVEAYAQGQVDNVTLYLVDNDRIRLTSRIFWYLQPERPIPGNRVAKLSVRDRRNKTANAILSELRLLHSGQRPYELSPVEKCGQALVSLKNWIFDELHVYARAFRDGDQRQDAERSVSDGNRVPAIRGVR